jgi:putative endonuclease
LGSFNNSQQIGISGEKLALEFLKKKNYFIKATNYHSRFGEIDIIAQNENYIIFVEVKTRKKNAFAAPMEYVNRSKQVKIIKTALLYLSEGKHDENIQPRFDVIEIVHEAGKNTRVNHIENAFFMERNDEFF